VRYEDLIRQPAAVVQQVLQRLGHGELPAVNGSLPSFDELNRIFPWFFRKGRPGAWRTEMSEDLQRLFWERYEPAMRAFGYSKEGAVERDSPMAPRCIGWPR